MIIIQHNRGFTDEEFEAIDVLWKHHSINFPLFHDLDEFLKKDLATIHNTIMTFREPELKKLKSQVPRLKKFKYNDESLQAWQKEKRGYKRFALGFSDSPVAQKAMKKRGLIVGDLLDIVPLAERFKEAEWRLHSQ